MSRDSSRFDRPPPYIIEKQFREEIEEGLSRINPYKPHVWTKDFLDRENNTYCTRTPKRWWQLLLGYTIFYLICTILIAIYFYAYYHNLSMEVPRWIAHQPSFSITPCDDDYIKYCNIEYKANESYKKYTSAITTMIKKYGDYYDDEIFEECIRAQDYGYKELKPCIFLKINKVIGFETEVYESAKELPEYAPMELKQFIDKLSIEQRKNHVWLSCEAINNNEVKIIYFPSIRAVNATLLKYKKKFEKSPLDYSKEERQELEGDRIFYTYEDMGRIVAIQLENLKLNEQVHVHCFMWAKNIFITADREHGAGRVILSVKLLS